MRFPLLWRKEPYRSVKYIVENGEFPVPIIVLDNQDGHINERSVEDPYQVLPQALVLLEGHRRLNIALYLQTTGRLNPAVSIWLMKKV